jgi:hypothetical protein
MSKKSTGPTPPRGGKLDHREDRKLPALIASDKRPDDKVLEDGGFSFDVDRHFLRLLPRFVQDRVTAIPLVWWDFSEEEIVQKTWPEHNAPDSVCEKLRIALWDEYDRCFRFKIAAMDFERCLRGICTMGYFRARVLADPGRIVFLCTPPPLYENEVRRLHQKGLSQLQQILDLPLLLPDGSPDAKIADVKRRIYESLDLRLKGAIVQRIDQRNINVDIKSDGSILHAERPDEDKSMEELEKELLLLEQRSQSLSVPGGGVVAEVIDAEITSEEGARDRVDRAPSRPGTR